ncbi:hypothetical protein T4D_11991 [Trichinella pseudospiralis]|uniref:Uncharacterized protein n=1 Tax=Trichinella pseudospiralis TaxID=6337 RepID=A0A0V1F3A9_TRIPS|nr:hypothetical protein T4D_11991 [Trichinella pseudospiralis]
MKKGKSENVDERYQNKGRPELYVVRSGSHFCKSGERDTLEKRSYPIGPTYITVLIFNAVFGLSRSQINHSVQLRKRVINRNTHGEERKHVEQDMTVSG